MIKINQNKLNEISTTLWEKQPSTVPMGIVLDSYLLTTWNDTNHFTQSVFLTDYSTTPERYQRFYVSASTDYTGSDPFEEVVNWEYPGFYHYKIYNNINNNIGDSIQSKTLEEGKLEVINESNEPSIFWNDVGTYCIAEPDPCKIPVSQFYNFTSSTIQDSASFDQRINNITGSTPSGSNNYITKFTGSGLMESLLYHNPTNRYLIFNAPHPTANDVNPGSGYTNQSSLIISASGQIASLVLVNGNNNKRTRLGIDINNTSLAIESNNYNQRFFIRIASGSVGKYPFIITPNNQNIQIGKHNITYPPDNGAMLQISGTAYISDIPSNDNITGGILWDNNGFVTQTSTSSLFSLITSSFSGSDSYLPVYSNVGNIKESNIRTNGSNVSINTTPNSTYGLNIVNPGTTVSLRLNSTANTGYSGVHFTNTAGTVQGHMGYGNITVGNEKLRNRFFFGSTSSGKDLMLTTNDESRILISGSGEVGVNTITPKSTFEVSGSVGNSINKITSNTSLNGAYKNVLVDATAGNITLYIPSASQATGREYNIKRIDNSGNTVTIIASGSLIDGSSTLSLTTQYKGYNLTCDESQWWIIGSY